MNDRDKLKTKIHWDAVSDPDIKTNNLISSEISSESNHGAIIINPLTGGWTYTPDKDFIGMDKFSITEYDLEGKSYIVNCDVVVEPLGDTLLPNLELTMSINHQKVVPGEIISYTLKVKNCGDIVLERVKISMWLASELRFLSDSVSIDGILQPTENISSGLNLQALMIGEEKIIQFNAEVISKESSKISNQFKCNYEYYNNLSGNITYGTANSDFVELQVHVPHLSLAMTINKEIAILGDTLTYTVIITNDGDIHAVDILFKDCLPDMLELIDGSFSINGHQINNVSTINGFYIDIIPIGHSIKLQYSGKVISLYGQNEIANEGSAGFECYMEEEPYVSTHCFKTEKVKIPLAMSAFQTIKLEQIFSLSADRLGAKQIIHISVNPKIINNYIIPTAKGISLEGQHATGKKLIVHGSLEISIEYTREIANKSIRFALFQLPFSTYIILPENYNQKRGNNVKVLVNGLYHKMITNHEFFFNCYLIVYLN